MFFISAVSFRHSAQIGLKPASRSTWNRQFTYECATAHLCPRVPRGTKLGTENPAAQEAESRSLLTPS